MLRRGLFVTKGFRLSSLLIKRKGAEEQRRRGATTQRSNDAETKA
jgi:hypothetical protein